MRYFFTLLLAVALALAPAGAFAGIEYFDLENGDDSTGDGTYTLPWKNIDKCTAGKTGGDECRAAKNTITTLSGNLTFTNGSATVTTGQDLTSEVAVGDIVGKNTGYEGWWRVAARDSSTLTLDFEYWGVGTSGAAVTGYGITPTLQTQLQEVEGQGSSLSSRLKISGGWDLSTQIQDGITAMSGGGVYNNIDYHYWAYLEISNFILSRPVNYCMYNAWGLDNVGSYFHDIWMVGAPTSALWTFDTVYCLIEDIVISGGIGDGVNTQSEEYNTFRNIYLFSVGTSSNDDGFLVGGTGHLFENIYIYNQYSSGLLIAGDNCFFKNVNYDTNRTIAGYCVAVNGYNSANNRFDHLTCENSDASKDIYITSSAQAINFLFHEPTFQFTYSGNEGNKIGSIPIIKITYDAADSVSYLFQVGVEHDSSAECRSGKCLKIRRTYGISYESEYKIGTVKITSAAKDIALRAWMKLSGSYNGYARFRVARHAELIGDEWLSLTTSWAQYSFTVDASDLVVGDDLELWLLFSGTDASAYIYVDDFSAAQ
jgi:hypothetical protein